MLEKAGKNSGDNRRDNRGLVLRMVATGACRTRRDLVVRTGLSKMTISNIVGEMIDGDVLRESEVVCSEEPGRNPCASGSHPKRRRQRAWRSSRAVVRVFCAGWTSGYSGGLARTCRRTLRRRCGGRPLSGCWTRCCPGRLVYGPSGLAADLPWRPGGEQMCPSESVRPAVRERYGLPVFLEDTCQSALLVESLFGRARNCPGRAVCQPGGRVGSAVLSGGQLCRGRGGRPLGLGHVTICAGGRPCRCGGRGCLELYVRSPEVLKKLYHRTGLEASYGRFLPDNRQRGSRPGVPGDRGLSGCRDRQRPESAEQRTGVAGRRRTLLDRPGTWRIWNPPLPACAQRMGAAESW